MGPEKNRILNNPDSIPYETRLQTVSNEIIPIFHAEEHPTLESFISPIFEESLANSRAISDGQMNVSTIQKNLIIVVGAPGSGKTHVVKELHQIRKQIGFSEDHFRPFSWEGAEDEVKVEFTEEEKAETYFSDHRMLDVNKVAMNQLNQAGSWVLGIGDYAPVATKINLGETVWMGKDAGATFIEDVTKNRPDINVHIIGLCPESRVVRLATPFRTDGATAQQVEGYRKKSISLALTLHEGRKINLPLYMIDTMRNQYNANPLLDEGFNEKFAQPIHEFARLLTEKKLEGKDRRRLIRGYNQILQDHFARQIAYDDVISLASLYMYKYAFENELNLPSANVFLGVSNPQLKKLLNAPVDWKNVF